MSTLPKGGQMKQLYAHPGARDNPGPYGPKIVYQYTAPNGEKYQTEALSREAAAANVWTGHMRKDQP